MKCNVGGTDRMERHSIALFFFWAAVFLAGGVWRYILDGYGLIRLLTGVFAFRPVYIPFTHTTRQTNVVSSSAELYTLHVHKKEELDMTAQNFCQLTSRPRRTRHKAAALLYSLISHQEGEL